MSDFAKTIVAIIVAVPSLASTFFMYEDRQRAKEEAQAKSDTIQLFINRTNEQNKKLAEFFATLNSNEQHSADTAKAN